MEISIHGAKSWVCIASYVLVEEVADCAHCVVRECCIAHEWHASPVQGTPTVPVHIKSSVHSLCPPEGEYQEVDDRGECVLMTEEHSLHMKVV